MDTQKETFKEEAQELLIKIEAALLELEENPEDMGQVDRAFRAMHTIKGSGAMFGFDDITDFAHKLETVFDLLRDGKADITRDLISLALKACDQIKGMLEGSEDRAESHRIIISLSDMFPEFKGFDHDHEAPPESIPEERRGSEKTYRIIFRPDRCILKNGTSPINLLNELRELGECDVTAHPDTIPLLKDYDHEACYLYWDIVLTADKGINEIKDVFIFVEDHSEIKIEIIDEGDDVSVGVETKRLGEILVDRGDVTPEKLMTALNTQKRLGEILVEEKIVSNSRVGAALREQQHMRRTREKIWKTAQTSSVRVPAERLDALVDLVGELVTVQARLTQKATVDDDPDLTSIAEDVEKLTNGLRDNTMSIRMVQIGSTFTAFRRLLRDLSKDLEKDVVLETEGGETELDKTVIDRLNDPMVHIIRNCIDHGIETPDIREASGKPKTGTIRLSAEHSGAHVIIRISDDGAGLDSETIRKKAIQNNVIASDAELSKKELFELIFAPGFSTAKKVTDVSGRGVGLDVVKRNVDALRGSVEVTSKKGEGATVILKLPLTLAIIEGLLVRLGSDKYVMPLSSVEECVELTKAESEKVQGRDILNVRDEIVPYVRLRKTFEIDGDPPGIEHVVITRVNGDRVGFVVDSVIGGHQTVIKPLGRGMKQSEDISGATILGDGTVALILDIDKLIQEQLEPVH